MVTTRSLRDDVQNLVDYLSAQGLLLYPNVVSMDGSRVAWHALQDESFLISRDDATFETYRRWVEIGAYSALLKDFSLLQITYTVQDGEIAGHRLAYVPCPFKVDPSWLDELAVGDLLDLYVEQREPMLMKSIVRFDFDPDAARPGHPAAHMTINSSDCRIACTAPMHVGRFANFVFYNFYPEDWKKHNAFFLEGARRDLGRRVIQDDDLLHPHVHWR